MYDWVDGVTLRVYAPVDGVETVTEVPAPNGSTATAFRTRRSGDTVTARTDDAPGEWHVLLVGTEPGGGRARSAGPGVRELVLRLPG